MTHKQITTGVFVLALAFALVATGGFSAAELDRNTSIQIVDDDRTAVGLQACYIPNAPPRQAQANDGGAGDAPANENGQANRVTPVRIEITNRLGSDLTVRELTVDGTIVHDRPYPATIEPGDSERITVPVRSAPSEVTATVSANGVSTRITVSDIGIDGCPTPGNSPSTGGSEPGASDESDNGQGGDGGQSNGAENSNDGQSGDDSGQSEGAGN